MLRTELAGEFPFAVRMSTKHGTKNWYENPAYQRLNPGQLLLTHAAIAADFFPFEEAGNDAIGEVISVQNLSRTILKGIGRRTVDLPVPINDITSNSNRSDYSAACLSYEARRLQSSGGYVALRGILPADIATVLSHEMAENATDRRALIRSILDRSDIALMLLPDYVAMDSAGLSFKLLEQA